MSPAPATDLRRSRRRRHPCRPARQHRHPSQHRSQEHRRGHRRAAGRAGQVSGLESLTDSVTKTQHRALAARDLGCAARGCTRPPAFCDAHHLQSRADGGASTLANLVLLCRRHHVLWHLGKITLDDLRVPWITTGVGPAPPRPAPPSPPGAHTAEIVDLLRR